MNWLHWLRWQLSRPAPVPLQQCVYANPLDLVLAASLRSLMKYFLFGIIGLGLPVLAVVGGWKARTGSDSSPGQRGFHW